MLIDVNIRELASFVEIVKLHRQYDRKGKIKTLTWQIRKIENSSLFERYMASGKQDRDCFQEEFVTETTMYLLAMIVNVASQSSMTDILQKTLTIYKQSRQKRVCRGICST